MKTNKTFKNAALLTLATASAGTRRHRQCCAVDSLERTAARHFLASDDYERTHLGSDARHL